MELSIQMYVVQIIWDWNINYNINILCLQWHILKLKFTFYWTYLNSPIWLKTILTVCENILYFQPRQQNVEGYWALLWMKRIVHSCAECNLKHLYCSHLLMFGNMHFAWIVQFLRWKRRFSLLSDSNFFCKTEGWRVKDRG